MGTTRHGEIEKALEKIEDLDINLNPLIESEITNIQVL